jgi:hypothetical protein
MVEENPSSVIISAHHYVLKNTTVASGDWEGFRRGDKGEWQDWYHGYYEGKGSPRGASYLYWVDSKHESGAFENYLAAAPGRGLMARCPHAHSPDDTHGGSRILKLAGATFINVAGRPAIWEDRRTVCQKLVADFHVRQR